jgi:hypothetical protein
LALWKKYKYEIKISIKTEGTTLPFQEGKTQVSTFQPILRKIYHQSNTFFCHIIARASKVGLNHDNSECSEEHKKWYHYFFHREHKKITNIVHLPLLKEAHFPSAQKCVFRIIQQDKRDL